MVASGALSGRRAENNTPALRLNAARLCRLMSLPTGLCPLQVAGWGAEMNPCSETPRLSVSNVRPWAEAACFFHRGRRSLTLCCSRGPHTAAAFYVSWKEVGKEPQACSKLYSYAQDYLTEEGRFVSPLTPFLRRINGSSEMQPSKISENFLLSPASLASSLWNGKEGGEKEAAQAQPVEYCGVQGPMLMKALEPGPFSHDSVVQNLLISLSEEIRGKFEVSEHNQAKIRESCAALESKLKVLAERMSNLETAVSEQEPRVLSNSQDISQLTRCRKLALYVLLQSKE
ncbi:hypothetical protein NDU88_001075 [Pleurodeles waltl]|uniref:Uncharacterized protein n=1 Tax=Pleurodeles waltl TaxID=8319 RepID=A0AAV7SAK1_PLEWA|nr:hypothetical protein NDU88_001075 [Pleurodeles waltl]